MSLMYPVNDLERDLRTLTDLEERIGDAFNKSYRMKDFETEEKGEIKEQIAHLMEVKSHTDQFATLVKKVKALQETSKRIREEFEDEDVQENIKPEEIEKMFDLALENMMRETDVADTMKDLMQSLDKELNDLMTDDTPLDEESADLTVTHIQETYIDPFTKQRLQDPVKNKACNHRYERDEVAKYMASKKNKDKRCPLPGCKNILREEDIIDDIELKLKLLHSQ